MKECIECKSKNIRFERARKLFVCKNCGFAISLSEYYKLIEKTNEKQSKSREQQRMELYKWLISKKE